VGQRILLTGIRSHLAGELARRLEADPDVEQIVGIDLEEPDARLERTEFIRADIRNPLVVKVLQTTEVDTLVHLGLLATPGRAGGRGRMKEINVIGAMQLFAACQRAELLRKVVVRSSTAVYGASPHDPAMFTEGMTARAELHGFGKDALEVEGYARTMTRRSPHIRLTVLRFANFIGPRIDSAMTRYLSLRVIPTALGYDPRLQLVHEDDAVEVLVRAVRQDHPGTFNVAGEGVITLSQAVRLMGKPPAPVVLPLASPLSDLLRRLGAVDFPADQLALLVYGRGVDTSRLAEEFAWRPRHSSRDALLEFVGTGRTRGPLTPERVGEWERRIRQVLGRRTTSGARAASDG
jgi:UDP-glucose 4-epimerase